MKKETFPVKKTFFEDHSFTFCPAGAEIFCFFVKKRQKIDVDTLKIDVDTLKIDVDTLKIDVDTLKIDADSQSSNAIEIIIKSPLSAATFLTRGGELAHAGANIGLPNPFPGVASG